MNIDDQRLSAELTERKKAEPATVGTESEQLCRKDLGWSEEFAFRLMCLRNVNHIGECAPKYDAPTPSAPEKENTDEMRTLRQEVQNGIRVGSTHGDSAQKEVNSTVQAAAREIAREAWLIRNLRYAKAEDEPKLRKVLEEYWDQADKGQWPITIPDALDWTECVLEAQSRLASHFPQGEKWISVKEIDRLPEFADKVLIANSILGSIQAERQPFSSSTIDNPEGWYWHLSNGTMVPKENVTHWQPLPAPPEEKPAK